MTATQTHVIELVVQAYRDWQRQEWSEPAEYAMNLTTRNLLVRQMLNPDEILPPDPGDHVMGRPITIDDGLPDWTVEAR